MTASINGHGEQKLTNGLISGHCYTLVGAQRMDLKNGSSKNLIMIRLMLIDLPAKLFSRQVA